MSTVLLVEILAYTPTAYYHCTHCEVAWREIGASNRIHQEQVNASLPPELLHEYARLSEWVKELFKRHCDQVAVKVIDATSVEGAYKTLRYKVRRFPAVIINRQAIFSGDDLEVARLEIARRLEIESLPA